MSTTTTTVKAGPPPAGMPTAPPLPDDLEALLRRLRMPHTRRRRPRSHRHRQVSTLGTSRSVAGPVHGRRSPGGTGPRWRPGGPGRPFRLGKRSTPGNPKRPPSPQPTQQALRTLEWLHRKENLVLCGPSGTGKTFFLEALGQLAVEQGLHVAWFTLEDLGGLIRRHRADDTVHKAIARILRAELIVVDDIGLLPVAADAAEGLYRLVDAAYEKRSVAISSNLHPAGFDELMPKTLATATVDRLLHHAHICQTSGDSIRLSQALTGRGVTPLTR